MEEAWPVHKFMWKTSMCARLCAVREDLQNYTKPKILKMGEGEGKEGAVGENESYKRLF